MIGGNNFLGWTSAQIKLMTKLQNSNNSGSTSSTDTTTDTVSQDATNNSSGTNSTDTVSQDATNNSTDISSADQIVQPDQPEQINNLKPLKVGTAINPEDATNLAQVKKMVSSNKEEVFSNKKLLIPTIIGPSSLNIGDIRRNYRYISDEDSVTVLSADIGKISNHNKETKTFDYTAPILRTDGADKITAYSTKAGKLQSDNRIFDITILYIVEKDAVVNTSFSAFESRNDGFEY